MQEIANALNAEGLRTRERVLRRRDGTNDTIGGRLFRSDGLRLILKNPMYRGALRFGGGEYTGRHEPVVSAELWDKANAAESRLGSSTKGRLLERDSQVHLLKGIAYCGSCGRTLVPHDSGKRNAAGRPYRYYYCGFVVKERAPAGCPVGRLPADGLEKVTTEILSQLSRHPEVVAQVIEAARERRKIDRPVLRSQEQELQRELEVVRKRERNLVDIAMNVGTEAITEAYKQRVAELQAERQRVTVELELKRHEVAACEAAMLDEKRIAAALEKLDTLLPKLPMPQQKELCRLFLEKIEVRKTAGRPEESRRILEIRMKMHLPRLVESMEERIVDAVKPKRSVLPISVRGLNFEARVDFTHAARGEIQIIAPFAQIVRLGGARKPPEARKTEQPKLHPIHEILDWQRLLEKGTARSQADLARRHGLTRAAVTQHMKLCQLAPEIIDWLKSLKTEKAVRQFSMTRMSRLADLPASTQRSTFSEMKKGFGIRM